jgi:hypothetical protein
MKFAISTETGTHFTLTIAPFYTWHHTIDRAACMEHVRKIVGAHAIIVEIKE